MAATDRRADNAKREEPEAREAIVKKLIFIAVVAVAALAVILDDGRPRRRWTRG